MFQHFTLQYTTDFTHSLYITHYITGAWRLKKRGIMDQISGSQMQQADTCVAVIFLAPRIPQPTCHCSISFATDPTNSVEIVG